jgi:catecholate siderophore receptor
MNDRLLRSVRAPAFLALGCVGFISCPALADTGAEVDVESSTSVQSDVEQHRADIIITGERATQPRLESPKATSSLLDTPQAVTVVSAEQLRRQNLLTLRDALATLPGITFGAGEGGAGYGDSINLRGYSANNDITIDGVRDSAQYSRTDPFNLQQIEVYNGANSAFAGSGSVGGTINLVSKVPEPASFVNVTAGTGTDAYWRGTIDTNQRLGELAAVRLNAMIHRNDYPGREVEHYRRWGIAPAITLGINGPSTFTLAYFHQRDDNVPVYGVPYVRNEITDGPLPGARRSRYFGFRNFDRQRIDVDRATGTFRHDFNSHLELRNLTRWQRVRQDSITTSPQGVFCLSTTGLQPVLEAPGDTQGAPCTNGLGPGEFVITGPHGRERDQENILLYNQTDLRLESGKRGRIHNVLDVGGQISHEDYHINTIELFRNPDGSAAALDIDLIADPAAHYDGPINATTTARASSRTNNQAIYAFDTLELGAMVQLNGGLRFENQNARFQNLPIAFTPPGTTPLTPVQLLPQRSDGTLFSYRAGVVFKPAANTSLYASFANSRTPASATVRLGCGTIAAPGAADPCASAPETARNYEVGAKANVFDNRLLLTAALFRNERSNFRLPSNDPANPTLQVVDGRASVDGVALGAVGNITRRWSILANYTYLESKVIQSVSSFCLDHPGAACGNSAIIVDPQRGDELIQTPRHSAGLFTTYKFSNGLQAGYGFTYQGAFALNQRNLNFRRQIKSDAFFIQRLYLAYELREGLTAQVNIQNLANAHYFTNIRNNVSAAGVVTGGWAVPGEGRSATLAVSYSF